MSFLSLTDADREAMLAAIGVSSVDELFRDIPEGVRLGRELALEPALSEPEIVAHLSTFYALQPEDAIYTGTPEGVGPVKPGDALTGEIAGVGTIALTIGHPL